MYLIPYLIPYLIKKKKKHWLVTQPKQVLVDKQKRHFCLAVICCLLLLYSARMSGRTRDYDEVTSFLGSFGHFQVVVIVLLSLSTVPCGYFGVMVVFVSDTPAHHCRIPLNSTATSTSEELHFEERSRQVGPDSCSRYKVQGNRTERAELANDTEQCLDGWVYSTEFSSTTAVSEVRSSSKLCSLTTCIFSQNI